MLATSLERYGLIWIATWPVGPKWGRAATRCQAPNILQTQWETLGLAMTPSWSPTTIPTEMLTVTGHRCAVLDGGISGWTGALSNDLSSRANPATFSPVPWPMGSVVDVVGVDTLRRSSGSLILDARSADRYEGWENPIDERFGHIPGAISAPWQGNIDAATGLMKTPAELRDRFRELGANPTSSIVSHCGSGVTACHNLLALEIAGFRSARLYPGSWSDWAADEDRPIATGLLPQQT
jgi:thiosulfate/3-mercaptopyruvate sulfurtransferase